METLSFSMHGQWTLLSKNKENDLPLDADFLSYRKQGELPEDHGMKGSLIGNPPSRSKKNQSKNKREGKVPRPVRSQYADNHPGQSTTT